MHLAWQAGRPVRRPTGGGGRAGVLVVSAGVGAGHDAAAAELAVRLRAAGVPVWVRDLLTVLPGPARRLLGSGYGPCVDRAPAAFELLVRRLEHEGLLWGAVQRVATSASAGVAAWCADLRPALVVSTYPVASQTLGGLRATGRLAAPVLTYLTDPAVHRSWLHPAVAAHLTVSAATAEHGRTAYGAPMTVAGPLVSPRFGRPVPPERQRRLRTALGLDAGPGRPLALVVAGSLGLGDPVPTVVDLLAVGATPVVLCGRNPGLLDRVARVPGAVALGWRDDVPDLMAVADVLVHNAGGMSCTEALVAGLPVVTHRPVPGHGRINAAVLHDAGVAPWARTRTELAAALAGAARRPRTRVHHPDPAALVLRTLALRGAGTTAA